MWRAKEKFLDNPDENILAFYNALAQVSLPASKAKFALKQSCFKKSRTT